MNNPDVMRCAIYARYSSNLQRDTSIEDQIRMCREYASRQDGWIVVDEFVRSDRAITAASLAGRDALQSFVEAAKQNPRPFDRLLVDDTSRFARNVEDSLRTVKILEFNGVHVVAISQGIDSQNKSARQLLTLHGMMDEQFLVGLADKVHRGQEGRVLKGLVSGGRCFGYRNVPIEDPSKLAKYGRRAVIGVRLEINEVEAAIVRRIFKMSAEGMSYARIAKTLNGEGVLSPMPSRKNRQRSWCTSSIFEMLHNERYHGVHVWNRTRKERNPETGRKVSRPRPESEWKRVDVPEWRIVPEDLWVAVQERLRERNAAFASAGASGVAKHQQYLFSGFLVCGECGAKLVIASGTACVQEIRMSELQVSGNVQQLRNDPC
ncbi:MAG: recombinase family protein [Terriglobia bacterium]|nr:recombinase family protein [Terriglobia bacterium]